MLINRVQHTRRIAPVFRRRFFPDSDPFCLRLRFHPTIRRLRYRDFLDYNGADSKGRAKTKKLFLGIAVIATGVVLFHVTGPDSRDVSVAAEKIVSSGNPVSTPSPDLSSVPLSFIPNRGQVNQEALFYAQTPGYTLWLTKEGLVFDSAKAIGPGSQRAAGPLAIPMDKIRPSRVSYERDTSRLIFLNSRSHPEVIAADPLGHRVNYFRGNKPENWRTGIQASAAVVYKELYPGIDLKVYGCGSEIEYDWIVRPGGNPGDIRFEYRDVRKTQIDGKGNIIVQTKFGEIIHRKPAGRQIGQGKRIEIETHFESIAKNTCAFDVSGYDPNLDLIIDPVVLIQSTYLGGSDRDYYGGIAVGSDGSVYIAGLTYSKNFPVSGAGDLSLGGDCDAFITKFSPLGKTLVYSTFLGGSGTDYGSGIALDGTGVVNIVGMTRSADFPLRNPFQSTFKGVEDAFVAKLAPGGDALVFSTYFGGSDRDGGVGIVVDGSGFMYVLGHTESLDFPSKNAFKSYLIKLSGSGDAFVTKFTPSGDQLVYSTYLGGEYFDGGSRIAVDADGAAYIIGSTQSADFPLKNPVKSNYRKGDVDAFITKLNPTGSSLIYSTYLGGSAYDSGNGLAVDSSGSAYIAGETRSSDFLLKNAFSLSLNGAADAFLMKVAPWGDVLEFSTYFGGGGSESAKCLGLDSRGNIYIAGSTSSSDLPLKRPFDSSAQLPSRGFLTGFTPSGNSLYYSAYFNGVATDMALWNDHLLSIAGTIWSSDLPVKNAYDPTYNGGDDVFTARFLIFFRPFRDW
jgi:hypothetical protein